MKRFKFPSIFIPLIRAACPFVLVALVVAPSVFAQTSKKDVEVYIGGRKYQSVAEYKKYQEERARFLSVDGKGSAEVIDLLLDDTLEKFSDEEVLRLITELKKRRKDLFQGDPTDMNFKQMKEMLDEYIRSENVSEDIDLNPDKMRTIVVDQNFLQMQSMLKEYIQNQDDDLDVRLDATKIKTITVSPKTKNKTAESDSGKNIYLEDDPFYNLGGAKIDSIAEEFQFRQRGLLSKEYNEFEGLPIESVLGSLKENPYFIFSLILNRYSVSQEVLDPEVLMKNPSRRFSLKILNDLIGEVSPDDYQRLKAREVKQVLQEFSHDQQSFAPDALSGKNYLGLGRQVDVNDPAKPDLINGKRFPLIMDGQKVATFTQFLKYQQPERYNSGKYIPLSDDFRKNPEPPNEASENSAQVGWGYDVQGIEAVQDGGFEGVDEGSKSPQLPPIVIDREKMDESALPENVHIDRVLNFKALNPLEK